MAEIKFENVSKSFGKTTVIENMNLTLPDGKFTVLLGPSGCGKTTLLRMIAGIGPESSGTVYMNGKDLKNVPPGERDIAMVFQSYALYPTMSVRENIEFCLKNNKILFLIDSNIERIIDTNEISKYIYMPFWKTNEKSVNIYFFIFILGIFCIFYNYIEFNIFILLVCGAICLFISVDFGNILHKMLVYFCINKTLSGFKIFPILIIEKPMIEKTVEKEIIPIYRYEADFKCYYIYFYNELVYKEIREYFLQNLNIDIDKIKKTISII